MKRRNDIDWEKIELDYRAGIKTLREIASGQNMSHGSITRRAKKEGWERDLSAKIKAKTDAIILRKAASNLDEPNHASKARMVTEKAVVDINAQVAADIRLRQRDDVVKARNAVMSLFDELDAVTENAELIRELVTDIESDRAKDALRKAITLPSRVDTVKKLVEALKSLVAIEDAAFGLADKRGGSTGTLADFFDDITRHNTGFMGENH